MIRTDSVLFWSMNIAGLVPEGLLRIAQRFIAGVSISEAIPFVP